MTYDDSTHKMTDGKSTFQRRTEENTLIKQRERQSDEKGSID